MRSHSLKGIKNSGRPVVFVWNTYLFLKYCFFYQKLSDLVSISVGKKKILIESKGEDKLIAHYRWLCLLSRWYRFHIGLKSGSIWFSGLKINTVETVGSKLQKITIASATGLIIFLAISIFLDQARSTDLFFLYSSISIFLDQACSNDLFFSNCFFYRISSFYRSTQKLKIFF